MMKLASVAMAAVLVASSGMASADAYNGAGKIVRGDYAAAERDLRGQQALYPDRVDLLLNLAAVYTATGRDVEARRNYRRVASQPDQEVVLSSGGSTGSHALAARGLARSATLVAAR